jgi:hypothetical protein
MSKGQQQGGLGFLLGAVIFAVVAFSLAGTVWDSASSANQSVGGGTAGTLYVLGGGTLFAIAIILGVLKYFRVI